MNTFWKTIASVISIITLVALIWAGASFWFGYCAAEKIHETDQDENILIAKNLSTTVVINQRLQWLEEQIIWLEHGHDCPNCDGRALINYKKIFKRG